MDIQIPFIDHLGVELLHKEPGHVVAALTIRPEMLNGWQVAHGGVIVTLADFTAGYTVRSLIDPSDWIATVSLNVTFIAPGKGRLICEGRVVHNGNSLGTCQAGVRDSTPER